MGRLTREIAFQYPEEEPKVANAAEIEMIVNELDDCVENGYLGADKRDEDDGIVEMLNAFLGSLSASKRCLFMMRYWFGMSIRTIANRYGLYSDDVRTELSGIREALKETFREAKTVWPVDGKTYLLKRIGEIDEAYFSDAETGDLKVSKSESGELPVSEDEEATGGKVSHAWKPITIVSIFAGVLAVAGFILAGKWFMNRNIPIDEAHFPNEYLREYIVSEFDLDEDGMLSKAEREEVFRIEIAQGPSYQGFMGGGYLDPFVYPIVIDTLTGIEYFPNLASLTCKGLYLKELDISSNKALDYLDCSGNQLTSLDVRSNKALEYLNCSNNLLTELDVRSNKALSELDCSNNQISKLKFRKNEDLKTLYCYNNQLGEIDVTAIKAIKKLYCFNNALLKLDLSKNTDLERISCAGNQLYELDFSKNAVLKWVDCSENQLHELNFNGNPMLKTLGCNHNRVESLDLSGNAELTELSCEGNLLMALNLVQCESLVQLHAEGNPLAHVELNKNALLSGIVPPIAE
jgi:ribonuclease I